MQVYSLISSLKTYHPTLDFTPWSLDLFISVPLQLHGEYTVLQPLCNKVIVHIVIYVLPGTHFHLRQVKHLRVLCLAQGHNIETMSQDREGRNIIAISSAPSVVQNRKAGSDIGRVPCSNRCIMSFSKIKVILNFLIFLTCPMEMIENKDHFNCKIFSGMGLCTSKLS